jgi:hypothetical protein
MVLPNLSLLGRVPVPTGVGPKQATITDEEWLASQTQRRINQYRSLDSVEGHADRALAIELTRSDLREAAIAVSAMLSTRIFELVRSNMLVYMNRTEGLLATIASGGPIDHMKATLHLQRAIAMMERYLEHGPRQLQAQLVDDDDDDEDEDEDEDEEALPVLYLQPSLDVVGPSVPDMIAECRQVLPHVADVTYQKAYEEFQEWERRYNADVRLALRVGADSAAKEALPRLIEEHRTVCAQMRMAARMRQRVLADSGMGLDDAVQEDVEQIERLVLARDGELLRAKASLLPVRVT